MRWTKNDLVHDLTTVQNSGKNVRVELSYDLISLVIEQPKAVDQEVWRHTK
jgi:hypothetical protein